MGPPDSTASWQTLSLLGEAPSGPSDTFHLFLPFCYDVHLSEVEEGEGVVQGRTLRAKAKSLQKHQRTTKLSHPALIWYSLLVASYHAPSKGLFLLVFLAFSSILMEEKGRNNTPFHHNRSHLLST